MNEEQENISSPLSDILLHCVSQIEFIVPDNYFEENEKSLMRQIQMEKAFDSDDFFEEQQNQIIQLTNLDGFVGQENEFDIPTNYFADSEKSILKQVRIKEKDSKIIALYATTNARMWYAIAAAACVASIIVLVWQAASPLRAESSFASLLYQSEITEEDMEYFASDEDYDELILSEINWLMDTTINDTSSVFQEVVPEQVPLDTKKENKKNKPLIKPKDNKKTPTWEEISEEELLEYLLEESDENLLDEL